MTNGRQYTKKKYTGNWSTIGTAAVFIFVGILGIIFLITPYDFISLSTWGYYLFIPAFFMLIGGTRDLLTDRRLRKTMLITAQAKGNSSVNLGNLSVETDIRANDVLRVLLDLRNDGFIKYRYDASSGEVVFGETVNYQKAPEFAGPMTKRQLADYEVTEVSYCPYCGHKPPAGAQFCESCGSRL